jgi:hypothetical protein
VVVLLSLQEQQAHEMHGARVVGIQLKRLLAAKLRVEMSPGAEMMKASFTKSSSRTRRRRFPSRPRVLGGCPALATAHRRLFKFDFQAGMNR